MKPWDVFLNEKTKRAIESFYMFGLLVVIEKIFLKKYDIQFWSKYQHSFYEPHL